MKKNRNLRKAHRAKNDEFYTQLSDIEKELGHYEEHFRDKVVYCNCDDPYRSAFHQYFRNNFDRLGLKKLITTCYKSEKFDEFSQNASERSVKLVYTGGAPRDFPNENHINVTPLESDGDFRSEECVELLKEADIVVTNPPFSLFREYVAQLIKYEKKFLIIGNMNAVTYREIFPLIKENKMWPGYGFNKTMEFGLSSNYERYNRIDDAGNKYGKVPAICWYTNLTHSKLNEELFLFREYTPEEYPKYDNYDAIEVSKTVNIPKDYDGVMGVPISFLDKYCPEQFEIVDAIGRYSMLTGPTKETRGSYLTEINGKRIYARILIKRKK